MSSGLRERVVAGHRAIVLENDRVRATILPALGGRVWTLEDLERGVQWVWHRPGVPLAAHPMGADYDAVWAGGWEELFPNDAAGDFEGRTLPDHGEWWTVPWEVDAVEGGDAPAVRLSARMTVRRARCEKEFRLPAGGSEVVARYRIVSEEPEPFHFLFKQHLPLDLAPGCRLVAPGGMVTAVDPSFGTLLRDPGPSPWPPAIHPVGEARDLRTVLAASNASREFVYVTGLPAGWCGADDPARGASLRMHWDLARMPHLWLFITYGGWRDAHTVVLEPCTNLPKDLGEAVRRGQAARLGPGEAFETSVRVVLSATSRTPVGRSDD